MELDDTDIKLIGTLRKDARISYTELSKELNLSDVAIKKRIDKLISNKVIENFTINLNLKNINKPIHAFFFLKCTPSESERIKEHIKENAEILKIFSTLGEYDFMIEVATRDVEQLRKIAEENIGSIRGVNQVRTLVVVQ